MDRYATDVTSTEHNNMTVIRVYGYENIRTESQNKLLKSNVQEPDGDPGQFSRPHCLLLSRISEVDHDPRHKVTFLSDNRLLAEPSCPYYQTAKRQ